jgi:hypothetical protein
MTTETPDTTPTSTSKSRHTWLKPLLLALAVIIALPALYMAYTYAASPAVIRQPQLEHYHFRMQILVNGKAENFSTKAYQMAYEKGQCTGTLPTNPIHFHDGKDQFVHIHWEAMTGGLVMKYYGWNYIGGPSGALGYRFDQGVVPKKLAIHGNVLPAVPKDATFYVYTGDENSYKQRSFDDWKKQDLETFFGVTSNFPAHKINKGQQTSLQKLLFPKAYAHGTATDSDGADGNETETEKLTRINNLIGNVVIFVQHGKPSDKQIKDRFNSLIPLDASTCGG